MGVLDIVLIALGTKSAEMSQNFAQCKSLKSLDCSLWLSHVFTALHLASQVTALIADSHPTGTKACH